MSNCTTAACPGLTGEMYLTGKGWVNYCPVCREITAAVIRQGEPDEADKLAAEAYTYAATQEYARAEEKLMQAAGLAADKDRRRFYLWYALLCRYGVYYVQEVLYPDLPARRTNLFVPTFGRFSLPDYKIRKCKAYQQLASMQLPGDAVKALNELYVLLLEIEDCINEEENRFQIFVAWHDQYGDAENPGPCRTFAGKLNDRLNAKRMFSFASFSALNEVTVAHYEPYIYAALASAQVLVIVIDDYAALGQKFLASEIVRFLTRRRDDRSLQMYFVGLEGHVGEVPESLVGIGGWQKHIENACDDNWCYQAIIVSLQLLLERKRIRKVEKDLYESVSESQSTSIASSVLNHNEYSSTNEMTDKTEEIHARFEAAQLVDSISVVDEISQESDTSTIVLADETSHDNQNNSYMEHDKENITIEQNQEEATSVIDKIDAQSDCSVKDNQLGKNETNVGVANTKKSKEKGSGFVAIHESAGIDSSEAMVTRGDYYRYEQNYIAAADCYQKASEMQNPKAICRLAEMYYNGFGVKQDYFIAFDLFHKAAKSGNVAAMYMLGEMYGAGEGTSKSASSSKKWFGQAAELGNSQAMMKLAGIYSKRWNIHDLLLAEKWYKKVEEVEGTVCHELGYVYHGIGFLYEWGNGVPKDKKKAFEYQEMAKKYGHS